MIDILSISVHAFTDFMLISLSADEIFLPRYVNWSTNFTGLPLKVGMAPSSLKHNNSVLFYFILKPMQSAACSRIYNKDSGWAWVFARSTRSSVEFASVIVPTRYRLFFCILSVKLFCFTVER